MRGGLKDELPRPVRPSPTARGCGPPKKGATRHDAGKKVSARKRPIVVDTMGLLLAVVVHPINIQDRDGARPVLAKLLGRCRRLSKDHEELLQTSEAWVSIAMVHVMLIRLTPT